MPSLTPELIANFPLSHYADPGSIQRGRAYYKDNRVWDVELVNDRKSCDYRKWRFGRVRR